MAKESNEQKYAPTPEGPPPSYGTAPPSQQQQQQPIYPAPPTQATYAAPQQPAPAPTGSIYVAQPAVAVQSIPVNGAQPGTIYVQKPPSTPFSMQCPRCQQQVVTRVQYEPGLLTWLLCGGIFCFGGIFGCCLIPFCVNDLKDVEHFCPNCNAPLAACSRI